MIHLREQIERAVKNQGTKYLELFLDSIGDSITTEGAVEMAKLQGILIGLAAIRSAIGKDCKDWRKLNLLIEDKE